MSKMMSHYRTSVSQVRDSRGRLIQWNVTFCGWNSLVRLEDVHAISIFFLFFSLG